MEYTPQARQAMAKARRYTQRAHTRGGPVTVKDLTTGEVKRVETPRPARNAKPRPLKTTRTCKWCSTQGLAWVRFQGSWRLVTRDGVLHECTDGKRASTLRGTAGYGGGRAR